MRNNLNHSSQLEPSVENLSKAIFVVNKHAKTAPNPKFLYTLKKTALQKLIKNGEAKKIGLHFSRNPKFAQQRSDVVVVCGAYTFHMPPTKEDFKELPHLGALDSSMRNPKAQLSLNHAKALLMDYTGLIEEHIERKSYNHTSYQQPVFKKLGQRY